MKSNIIVKDFAIKTMQVNGVDYISITDIAKQKNSLEPKDVVKNWIRLKKYFGIFGFMGEVK